MAEIPAFRAIVSIDADGDGAASGVELQGWADAQAAIVAERIELTADGERIPLAVGSVEAGLRPGQAGLDTLRLDVVVTADVSDPEDIAYVDPLGEDETGWREVSATGVDGVALASATVPVSSPSDLLRAYPDDLLIDAPDVVAMRADVVTGPSDEPSVTPAAASTGRPGTETGGFASALGNRGAPLIAAGLVLAMLVGAWHAVLPGHGKTLMAAVMVGSAWRARHVAAIAITVALMHTTSVLVLGVAIMVLQRTFRPESIYPWLGALSGIAALVVGVYLVRQRWHAWRHHRGHDHHHDHDSAVLIRPDGGLARGGVLALGLAGGLLPAPSALLAMLAAIQMHRVGYGIALVLAFSVGLAAALMAVGVGAVRARDVLARRSSAAWTRAVPLVSACAIVVAGGVVAARAFASI